MTSSQTPQTPLEIHYHLRQFCSFIATLFVFLSSQDMSHRMFITKEKARQDHLGNFSAPAVNTLTQRRHSGRLPANRLGTADTNVCPAPLRERSVSRSCWSWTNYSPAWVLNFVSPPRPFQDWGFAQLVADEAKPYTIHWVMAVTKTSLVGMI